MTDYPYIDMLGSWYNSVNFGEHCQLWAVPVFEAEVDVVGGEGGLPEALRALPLPRERVCLCVCVCDTSVCVCVCVCVQDGKKESACVRV